jgi:hypothetical protein
MKNAYKVIERKGVNGRQPHGGPGYRWKILYYQIDLKRCRMQTGFI